MGQKWRGIYIAKWSDFYTMGAFCEKTNLVAYACMYVKKLRTDPAKRVLFEQGRRDACEISLEMLAYEIKTIRDLRPEGFDKELADRVSPAICAGIMRVLENAKDWESPELVERGREILGRVQSEAVYMEQIRFG